MVTPAVTSALLELNRTGKLRILAVTSPPRLIATTEIPTAVETGLPGMISQQSIGLFAPAGTPKAIIEQNFAGDVHGARRRNLPANAHRVGFRTRRRFNAGQIPPLHRRRHCPVVSCCQSDRTEARLNPEGAARSPRSYCAIRRGGAHRPAAIRPKARARRPAS